MEEPVGVKDSKKKIQRDFSEKLTSRGLKRKDRISNNVGDFDHQQAHIFNDGQCVSLTEGKQASRKLRALPWRV